MSRTRSPLVVCAAWPRSIRRCSVDVVPVPVPVDDVDVAGVMLLLLLLLLNWVAAAVPQLLLLLLWLELLVLCCCCPLPPPPPSPPPPPPPGPLDISLDHHYVLLPPFKMKTFFTKMFLLLPCFFFFLNDFDLLSDAWMFSFYTQMYWIWLVRWRLVVINVAARKRRRQDKNDLLMIAHVLQNGVNCSAECMWCWWVFVAGVWSVISHYLIFQLSLSSFFRSAVLQIRKSKKLIYKKYLKR